MILATSASLAPNGKKIEPPREAMLRELGLWLRGPDRSDHGANKSCKAFDSLRVGGSSKA